jgi:RHS repeat-associated protein
MSALARTTEINCDTRAVNEDCINGGSRTRTKYTYDPYGNRSTVSGAAVSDIGYAGYYNHPDSGLAFALYRAYDPTHARWLNRDPIGVAGGINLYAYTSGNPVSGIDPLGLAYKLIQSGNTITIQASITAYGANASDSLAQSWQSDINKYWNNNGDNFMHGKCKVKFDVTVTADPNANWWFTAQSADNYVYVVPGPFRSWVQSSPYGTSWYGRWSSTGGGWTAAHESGHLFGLPDDYHDVGATSVPNPGHAGHMMGDYGKPVNQHEIDDILRNAKCSCGN